MVRKKGDLTCSDNLPSRSQSGKKHGLPGLSMLLEKLSEKEKITHAEAYDKVQSILSQPLNSTAQIVVIMDSTDKPPTVLLALATRISEELFDGEELERTYKALSEELRDSVLIGQGFHRDDDNNGYIWTKKIKEGGLKNDK